MKTFRVPKDIVFGWGALEYLKQVKGKKAFIVTDKVIESLGFVEKVKGYLEEAGLQTMVFSETEPDPSRDTVEKGTQLMKEFKPDWIVGLGGGSAIDAAKGMWVRYEHPDLAWDEVFGVFPPLRQKAKFIAIATTSGTGSEVTCASVITNRNVEPHVKNVIASNEITPDIAIADPELASQMPPKVTAATGMDVLTHAIESYTSIAATEVDKALTLKVIQMVFRSLPKAYADGRNQQAREDMHTASFMAGMAFTNSFLGIVHSLAHQLGSQYGIPHGAANSLMLPYVIKFNAIAVPELYAEIADALNIKYEGTRDAVDKLVEAIFQLQKDIGQPQVIKAAGVDENTFFERLDATAQNALNDICTYCNPRVPNVEDMKQLYKQAFGK
ncbi:iron-containing alcohol dehydrogenase [Desulforamulus aquiferis]|uniref:Iron-containing alcohol dehydrogenase n=1 Tax=Desulforamulus aquiferis TaxID=1397668 RepID=A0AAW7ZFK2_9FIRM|nr:iron-containing alcohol dehydrogenase [Desulforamulus aquiferis]MDO7788161.1 iron-containing alcohol dehydrogenase [Desulforamulus aquiferis]